jgi:hypothetical protein
MGRICVTNLGPKQQLLRWIWAVSAAVTAMTLLAVCAEPCAYVRTGAVVLITLGGFCALQATQKTCVILAFAGKADRGDGPRPVVDGIERVLLRRRGWNIVVQSLGVSAAATACAILV